MILTLVGETEEMKTNRKKSVNWFRAQQEQIIGGFFLGNNSGGNYFR
jgi:hypothetical protein